jgi:hypothetical protein
MFGDTGGVEVLVMYVGFGYHCLKTSFFNC